MRIVVEPEGRNTAAAIALAALDGDRDPDEVMLVLPADHRIDPGREGLFRAVLRRAADGLATGAFGVEAPLVTLGVEVTAAGRRVRLPHPGRGAGRARIAGLRAYPLRAFEEKPTPPGPPSLRATPGVAWNAGMFLWRRRAIVAARSRRSRPRWSRASGAACRPATWRAPTPASPSHSIDYAVMEPAAAAGDVVMAAMDVGWSDIGTWPALLEVLGAAGIDGGVVEAGATGGDVGRRPGRGARPRRGLVVREAPEGTIRPDEPIALLHRAADARAVVQALLDRCAAAEARA